MTDLVVSIEGSNIKPTSYAKVTVGPVSSAGGSEAFEAVIPFDANGIAYRKLSLQNGLIFNDPNAIICVGVAVLPSSIQGPKQTVSFAAFAMGTETSP